ncbi:Mitosis inhibitor kinase SWE1 [Ceratobasidium theobromae]|uniref:Mitosis inhibitor kinase SWE1 n=1 Tax=Ceratobasidium theobromae TaxID=1582974 RepID=A0A5N5Q8P4_9AGAM|nr:Mitosis inhibitor kinase SWE1 [Ceratobasidium theobromae]
MIPAFPPIPCSSLNFGSTVNSLGPIAQCRPLTWLSSNTTFAQLLIPLSDLDLDSSDLNLDIDGESIIWGFGIDNDVKIHNADPDNSQDISIINGEDKDNSKQSWHTAVPFTPGNSMFSGIFVLHSNEELQPKRHSLDYSIGPTAMPKLLLTPSHSQHCKLVPKQGSPPDTSPTLHQPPTSSALDFHLCTIAQAQSAAPKKVAMSLSTDKHGADINIGTGSMHNGSDDELEDNDIDNNDVLNIKNQPEFDLKWKQPKGPVCNINFKQLLGLDSNGKATFWQVPVKVTQAVKKLNEFWWELKNTSNPNWLYHKLILVILKSSSEVNCKSWKQLGLMASAPKLRQANLKKWLIDSYIKTTEPDHKHCSLSAPPVPEPATQTHTDPSSWDNKGSTSNTIASSQCSPVQCPAMQPNSAPTMPQTSSSTLATPNPIQEPPTQRPQATVTLNQPNSTHSQQPSPEHRSKKAKSSKSKEKPRKGRLGTKSGSKSSSKSGSNHKSGSELGSESDSKSDSKSSSELSNDSSSNSGDESSSKLDRSTNKKSKSKSKLKMTARAELKAQLKAEIWKERAAVREAKVKRKVVPATATAMTTGVKDLEAVTVVEVMAMVPTLTRDLEVEVEVLTDKGSGAREMPVADDMGELAAQARVTVNTGAHLTEGSGTDLGAGLSKNVLHADESTLVPDGHHNMDIDIDQPQPLPKPKKRLIPCVPPPSSPPPQPIPAQVPPLVPGPELSQGPPGSVPELPQTDTPISSQVPTSPLPNANTVDMSQPKVKKLKKDVLELLATPAGPQLEKNFQVPDPATPIQAPKLQQSDHLHGNSGQNPTSTSSGASKPLNTKLRKALSKAPAPVEVCASWHAASEWGRKKKN